MSLVLFLKQKLIVTQGNHKISPLKKTNKQGKSSCGIMVPTTLPKPSK